MSDVAAHRRFVTAVYRRTVVVSTVESYAVASAVVAGVAIPMLVLLRASGRPIVPVIATGVVAGIIVGSLVLRRRWPTTLSAAASADRHFAWDDLLATAATPGGDVGFSAAVRLTADARCVGRRPAEVPVVRLRLRAYIVTVTLVGLAALVAAWPTVTGTSSTAAESAENTPDVLAAAPPADGRIGIRVDAERPPQPAVNRADDRAAVVPPSGENADERTHTPAGGGSAVAAAAGGAGRGQSGRPLAPRPAAPTAGADTHANVRGATPAGGGAAVVGGDGHDRVGRTVAVGPGSRPRSDSVASGATKTENVNVDDRSVPARDRALVRQFFDRPPGS